MPMPCEDWTLDNIEHIIPILTVYSSFVCSLNYPRRYFYPKIVNIRDEIGNIQMGQVLLDIYFFYFSLGNWAQSIELAQIEGSAAYMRSPSSVRLSLSPVQNGTGYAYT